MNALATRFSDGLRVEAALLLVTSFGIVRIHPETAVELTKIYPPWLGGKIDRRTRGWKKVAEIERDIHAIAEVEWIHGEPDSDLDLEF